MVRGGDGLIRNRHGKSRLGCLVWVLVLSAIGYYGLGIGQHYLAYYRMLDEIQSQARLAPGLDDGVIRRRLVIKADELDLPPDAHHVVIRRTERPREIMITTSWQVILEVPFYTRPVTFHPTSREPL